MLRDGKPYRDPQIDYEAQTANKNKARWLRMLHKANLLQQGSEAAAEQLRHASLNGLAPAASPAVHPPYFGAIGPGAGLSVSPSA